MKDTTQQGNLWIIETFLGSQADRQCSHCTVHQPSAIVVSWEIPEEGVIQESETSLKLIKPSDDFQQNTTKTFFGDISVFFQNSDQKEIEKCCWGEKKFQKLKSAQYERSCPPRWLKFTTIHWNWKTWTLPEHITEITLIHYKSNMCGEKLTPKL